MSIICSKFSKNNCRLPTALRVYASHTDRSNSQPSSMDTHRTSKIDMLGNSIFFELIVYSRKLVFHITGITKSCNSSSWLSRPKAYDTDGVSILRKAWGRNEGILMSILSREEWKVNYFFFSQKRSASQGGTSQTLYFPQM